MKEAAADGNASKIDWRKRTQEQVARLAEIIKGHGGWALTPAALALNPATLTVKELADRLRVTPGTIYRMVAADELPYFRTRLVRGVIRFDAEELRRWFAFQEANRHGRHP